MAPKTKTTTPTDTSIAPQVDIDALYSTIAKQQQMLNRASDDNWKPTAIPLANRQTPVMPMQITGSLAYDNTPNTYVAPAYGQLTELSKKKDIQGKGVRSAWDKTKETLMNSLPEVNDPSFQAVKARMGETIDEYDKKLKDGIWSEQENIAQDFSDVLFNKRGGKQFMAIKQAKETQRAAVESNLLEYNPEKGIEGIRADEVAYYQTAKKISPFVEDVDGNIIGGGNLVYPTIYKNRNMPSELDAITTNTAYFQDAGFNKETGEKQYLADTGLFGKYMTGSEKYISQARVNEIGRSYLMETGALPYIQNQAEIAQFNKPMTASEGREMLLELAKVQKGDNKEEVKTKNDYQVLADLSDQQLQERLDDGLGTSLATTRSLGSLLSGSAAKVAYSQKTIDFENDTVAQHAENARTSALYTKAKEEKEEAISVLPYSFTGVQMGVVNVFDPNSAIALLERQDTLGKEISNLSKYNEAMKSKPNYQNDPDYKSNLQKIADMDNELKNLRESKQSTVNYFGDLIKTVSKDAKGNNGVGLFSSYAEFAGQKEYQGDNIPPSRDQYYSAVTSAIPYYAKVLKEEGELNAHEKLKGFLANAGIGPTIDYTGNSVISDVKRSTFAGNRGGGVSSTSFDNTGNLFGVIMKSGKELNKRKEKGQVGEVSRDATVFYLDGETSTRPESVRYSSAMKNVETFIGSSINSLKAFNPTGNAKNDLTFVQSASNELDVDTADFVNMFGKPTVRPSTMQGTGSARGKAVYLVEYPIKNLSKSVDGDLFSKQEKVIKKMKGGDTYKAFVTLGDDQNLDAELTKSLQGMLLANPNVVVGMSDRAREQGSLLLGNITGVSDAIDMLQLYELDGSGKKGSKGSRDISFNGFDLRVTAENIPFARNKQDKDFNIQFKENGQYKTVGILNGAVGTFTDDELKANKDITIKQFGSTLDIKSFFSTLQLKNQYSNFNQGSRAQQPATSKTAEPNNREKEYYGTLTRNGKSFATNAYVPIDQLTDLTGRIKIKPDAGIPFVKKSVASNVVNVFNKYGLTLSGGLRTKEHIPKGSANNSSHFAGNTVDLRKDEQSIKLFKDLNSNPKLADELGIEWFDWHDRGSGYHVHLKFKDS